MSPIDSVAPPVPPGWQSAAMVATGFVLVAAVAALAWQALMRWPPRGFWQRQADELRGRKVHAWDAWPVLITLIASLSPALIALARPPAVAASTPSATAMMVTSLLLHGLLVLAAVAGLRARGNRLLPAFGCEPERLTPAARAGVTMGLAAIPAIFAVALLWTQVLAACGWQEPPQQAVRMLGDSRISLWGRIGLTVTAVAIAPVAEEFAFRGVLLPILVRQAGLWRGTLALALFFGLIHLHVTASLPLATASVAFSLGYLATGSLCTAIVMHAIFNATNLLGYFAFGM